MLASRGAMLRPWSRCISSVVWPGHRIAVTLPPMMRAPATCPLPLREIEAPAGIVIEQIGDMDEWDESKTIQAREFRQYIVRNRNGRGSGRRAFRKWRAWRFRRKGYGHKWGPTY
mmetsp:Transcript_12262/g.27156  ORF Transcript_12262/g.27156 Transcript_12262/m.27156 type:complete len:115 (-) Transcript_12262:37-381(-)